MADKGTAAEQPADEASLSDDLRTAFDTLADDETPDMQASEEAESESEESSDEEEAAPEETQASGESASEEEAGETEEDEETADASPIDPPQHWAEEHKEQFRNLPRTAQDFVLERHKQMEADYTRKTTEIADVRKAIEPVKQHLELNGISEGDYISRLRAADQYLSQSPQEAIQWLAQSYGIDLSKFGQQQESEDDEFKDPYVQQLEEKVRNLEGQFQSRQQQEQQASQQQVEQQVQEFANATDEQGNPKHPHFPDVRPYMGALLNSGAAKDMEEAYEQAVWARPELRQQLLDQQRKDAAQQAEKQRKEKAAKAKKAATPASSGTTAETPETPADLRSDLERTFDQLST